MGPKTYEGPANPGLHRVGQQLGTELRKRCVKGTDEKDLVKNDHEDSARSSGVTGTPWPIAPVFIRRNTTMARSGESPHRVCALIERHPLPSSSALGKTARKDALPS